MKSTKFSSSGLSHTSTVTSIFFETGSHYQTLLLTHYVVKDDLEINFFSASTSQDIRL